MELNTLLNDFAIRCFRDIADSDYIAARMACRAALVTQFLWASEQALEKYLKCILLLNRIPAKNIRHNLDAALEKINSSGKLRIDITNGTQKFIEYVDTFGRFRYFEVSHYSFGADIVALDQAVWELRRYCTLDELPRRIILRDGAPAPRIRLPGGGIEKIIDNPKNPAREPLLWANAFFGRRARKTVRVRRWFKGSNAPLYLNPQILDDVLKYVYLPKELEDAFRAKIRLHTSGSGQHEYALGAKHKRAPE